MKAEGDPEWMFGFFSQWQKKLFLPDKFLLAGGGGDADEVRSNN